MRLGDGDSLSVQGSLGVQIYQPGDREARISMTLFVDAVLPLRAPPRARKEKAPDPQPAQPPATRSTPCDYDDTFPF
jgi:hypothetical protein